MKPPSLPSIITDLSNMKEHLSSIRISILEEIQQMEDWLEQTIHELQEHTTNE